MAGSLLFVESSKRLSAPLMSILEQEQDELFQGVTVSDDPRNTSSTYASLSTSVWGGDNDSPSTTKSSFSKGKNVWPSGTTSPETSRSTKDTSVVPRMLLVAIDEELIVAVDPVDVMERKYLTV
jgi:hypothetical protein